MSRIVVWMSLLTGALGIAGLVLAALGPATFLYPPPGSEVTGTTSLWQAGELSATFGVYVLAMALGTAGFVAGGLLRASGGGSGLLWMSLVVLTIGCGATLPGNSTVVTPAAMAATIPDAVGIGVYLAPAALTGLVTALLAMAVRPEVTRPGWA